MGVINKFILFIILVIFVFSLIGCNNNTNNTVNMGSTNQNTQQTNSNLSNTDSQTKIYTLSDIASHSTANSCWMAVNGKVYDVTSFIPNHPGGSAILVGCGKDATYYFNTKGGRGRPHSQTANELLQQYYIGDLAN